VSNGEGTITGDVNNVVVSCSDAFLVEAEVSAFSGGSNFQLRNSWTEGGQDAFQSVDVTGNGTVVFSGPAAPDSNGQACLQVKQYPASPDQLCCVRAASSGGAHVEWAGMYLNSLWAMGYDDENARQDQCTPTSYTKVCVDQANDKFDFEVSCNPMNCLLSAIINNLAKPWCRP